MAISILPPKETGSLSGQARQTVGFPWGLMTFLLPAFPTVPGPGASQSRWSIHGLIVLNIYLVLLKRWCRDKKEKDEKVYILGIYQLPNKYYFLAYRWSSGPSTDKFVYSHSVLDYVYDLQFLLSTLIDVFWIST